MACVWHSWLAELVLFAWACVTRPFSARAACLGGSSTLHWSTPMSSTVCVAIVANLVDGEKYVTDPIDVTGSGGPGSMFGVLTQHNRTCMCTHVLLTNSTHRVCWLVQTFFVACRSQDVGCFSTSVHTVRTQVPWVKVLLHGWTCGAFWRQIRIKYNINGTCCGDCAACMFCPCLVGYVSCFVC